MRLYCTACQTTHWFRNSQVERLIYGFQFVAMRRAERCLGDVLRETERPGALPITYRTVETKIGLRKRARVTLP